MSTPGVARPLTTAEHFRRNVGRLVEVERADGTSVSGRVRRVDEHEAILEVPAERKQPAHEVEVALAMVRRGRVQVEFNRPQDTADETEQEH